MAIRNGRKVKRVRGRYFDGNVDTCLNKRPYRTVDAAKATIKKVQGANPELVYTIYLCQVCFNFHLTTRGKVDKGKQR